MRSRTSNNISSQSFIRQQFVVGTGTTTVSSSAANVGTYGLMFDDVVPKFKERRNRGELFFNSMQRHYQVLGHNYTGYGHSRPITQYDPAGTVVADNFGSLLNWKLGTLPYGVANVPVSQVSSSYISDTIALASTKALSGWKEASVQSIVFLAELQKTINTLKNPIQAVLLELERGRRLGFSLSGGLRGASGQYLTWFYGIRSLMFDIEGAAKALEVKKSDRETSRGNVTYSETFVTPNLVLHQGSVLADSRYKITQIETFTARAGLMGQFEGASMVRGFGLRLRDVPAAVWELTPWSFVLDWFLNIGDFIQSLSVDTSLGVKGQWLTTEHVIYYERAVTSTTLVNPNPGGWSVTTHCADKDYGTYVTKYRNPVSLANYSGIRLRNNLNRVPVLAALALVTQKLLSTK